MSDKVWKEWGGQLRRARLACGLHQNRLAARCGMSAGTISNIERGNHRPAVDSVRILCAVPELKLTPPECYLRDRRRVEARVLSLGEMAAAGELLTTLVKAGHVEAVRSAVNEFAGKYPHKARMAETLFHRILIRKELAS